MGQHVVALVEADEKHGVGQQLNNLAIDLDGACFGFGIYALPRSRSSA